MAFIVKGLNMPTCCDMCEFCIQDFDNLVAFCSASNIYWNNISDVPYDKCHPSCPLIELPPHGRLIDADKLLTDRMKSKYYHLPNGDTAIPIIDIEHAPTVLEAEDEE